MAKANGKGKTRQTIKVQEMRKLMFESGGRCAMTDCGLPLTSPTGGWIGTVAHIIGAESDGPRGKSPLTPEERAFANNLILMCATHGREVDAPETGERSFPVDRLRLMKAAHAAKVTGAVAAAIQQDLSGVQTATGTIDTALRPANAAGTAEGLLECLGISEDASAAARFISALADARTKLQLLSQPALDSLSQLLELWLMECHDHSDGSYNFGDVSGTGPYLPLQNVQNRFMRGPHELLDKSLKELESRKVIEIQSDEYAQTLDYAFLTLWKLEGKQHFNFWISTAEFLHEAHGVQIHAWIRGLDFSIFDRTAPENG